jgi:hypothetical protein
MEDLAPKNSQKLAQGFGERDDLTPITINPPLISKPKIRLDFICMF